MSKPEWKQYHYRFKWLQYEGQQKNCMPMERIMIWQIHILSTGYSRRSCIQNSLNTLHCKIYSKEKCRNFYGNNTLFVLASFPNADNKLEQQFVMRPYCWQNAAMPRLIFSHMVVPCSFYYCMNITATKVQFTKIFYPFSLERFRVSILWCFQGSTYETIQIEVFTS